MKFTKDPKDEIQNSRSCLATHQEVMALLKVARKAGLDVDHKADVGTVDIRHEGQAVYWDLRKGGRGQPWIVRFNTEIFQPA